MIDDGRPSEQHAVHRRMQEQLATLPGIAATALSQTTPMHGGLSLMFEVPGFTWGVGRHSLPMINAVDPAFLDVMGMRIVEGRGFSEADNRPGAPTVAVVNETHGSEAIWSGNSPLGRCILIGRQTVHAWSSASLPKASPFASLRGEWSDADRPVLRAHRGVQDLNDQRVLVVRTSGDPRAILSRLRTRGADGARRSPIRRRIPARRRLRVPSEAAAYWLVDLPRALRAGARDFRSPASPSSPRTASRGARARWASGSCSVRRPATSCG